MRGDTVAYVPQDPSVALNPTMRIGDHVRDIQTRGRMRAANERKIREVFERVHLPTTREFLRRFPHQVSGGQQQRVTIAMAFIREPLVVVMDEPTTGLDVVTQAKILAEVRRLQEDTQTSVVYISHNLAVVYGLVHRVAVMYGGRIVESGGADGLLTRPRHPYTRSLIASVPDHVVARRLRGLPGVAVGVIGRPAGCHFAPRCQQRIERCGVDVPGVETVGVDHSVRCHMWFETPAVEIELREFGRDRFGQDDQSILRVQGLEAGYRQGSDRKLVVRDVSFALNESECLAVVGESGSGKTTIARCVIGLHRPYSGVIRLDGEPLAAIAKQRSKEARRRIQIVFQNPYESLNPRHSVGYTLSGVVDFFLDLNRRESEREAAALLERVRLPAEIARRLPGELSGGEQQRVALARALAARPETSSSAMRSRRHLMSLSRRRFSRSLETCRRILASPCCSSRTILVWSHRSPTGLSCLNTAKSGAGPVESVMTEPQNAYTRGLLDAAPVLPIEARSIRGSSLDR